MYKYSPASVFFLRLFSRGTFILLQILASALTIALFFWVFVPLGILAIVICVPWLFYQIFYSEKYKIEKREKAVKECVERMDPPERSMWLNKTGIYSEQDALPRAFPVELMDWQEKSRWQNREGEFADDE